MKLELNEIFKVQNFNIGVAMKMDLCSDLFNVQHILIRDIQVTQLVRDPQDWRLNKVIKIGVALNPSLALINHSCDPNYARVVRGKSVLAFATRNIRKVDDFLYFIKFPVYLSNIIGLLMTSLLVELL